MRGWGNNLAGGGACRLLCDYHVTNKVSGPSRVNTKSNITGSALYA